MSQTLITPCTDVNCTAGENNDVTWDIEGVGECRIEIWDTGGQEALESLRKAAYPGTQVLLMAFDMCNSVTLENVADWHHEFREACDDRPCIILVGTKYDWLKDEPDAHESPCDINDGSIMEVTRHSGPLADDMCLFRPPRRSEPMQSCSLLPRPGKGSYARTPTTLIRVISTSLRIMRASTSLS